MTRSIIICTVTTSRATSVLAVMSPKPTVANTVTLKYSPLVWGHGRAEVARRERCHDDVGAGEQQQENGTLMPSASRARRAGHRDVMIQRIWKVTNTMNATSPASSAVMPNPAEE